MLRYLSLDIICSSKLTVFLELRFRKTLRFSEQIMSADKNLSIFSVIISSYPASPRRITVLVNFQGIVFIFSGEPPQIVIFSLPEHAAKNFFPTSKISAQEIRHQYFLICSNLTIMAHIMGLGHQSESWKITILS